MIDDACLRFVVVFSWFHAACSLLFARCFLFFPIANSIRYYSLSVLPCVLRVGCWLCVGCCLLRVASLLLIVDRCLTYVVCRCLFRVVGISLFVFRCAWLLCSAMCCVVVCWLMWIGDCYVWVDVCGLLIRVRCRVFECLRLFIARCVVRVACCLLCVYCCVLLF